MSFKLFSSKWLSAHGSSCKGERQRKNGKFLRKSNIYRFLECYDLRVELFEDSIQSRVYADTLVSQLGKYSKSDNEERCSVLRYNQLTERRNF